MKRFIIKILLLALPISFYAVIQEYALRTIPNDYAYKNQWLTENAQSLKILSLGSSHGFFGIQPTEFSQLAFNAGHVSQSLLFDEFIFDKFLPQMESLEYVILPISYFTMRGKGLQYGEEKWRVKNYTIYYNCPYFRCQPQFALESDHFAPKKTLKALFTKVNHRGCDSLGRGIDYSLESRSDDWQTTGPVAMKRHTKVNYSQSDVDKNLSHINHIVEVCKNRGIKVILLTTPTYHTYYDILDEDQLEQMISCCELIASNYENVIYFNWLKHSSFDENDFFDADHLNEFGAIKLTTLLNQEISTQPCEKMRK